jgi:hypothetical protein
LGRLEAGLAAVRRADGVASRSSSLVTLLVALCLTGFPVFHPFVIFDGRLLAADPTSVLWGTLPWRLFRAGVRARRRRCYYACFLRRAWAARWPWRGTAGRRVAVPVARRCCSRPGALSGGGIELARWNLLILRFSASTERVRLVWSSSDAFGKDIFSQHGGSCTVVVVSMEAAGAAPGLLSSCSVMATPVCFPYQQRSSSGRWVFNVLSMLWWVHGIGSCGVFQCLELLFIFGRWFSAGFMCVVKGFVLCWLVAI